MAKTHENDVAEIPLARSTIARPLANCSSCRERAARRPSSRCAGRAGGQAAPRPSDGGRGNSPAGDGGLPRPRDPPGQPSLGHPKASRPRSSSALRVTPWNMRMKLQGSAGFLIFRQFGPEPPPGSRPPHRAPRVTSRPTRGEPIAPGANGSAGSRRTTASASRLSISICSSSQNGSRAALAAAVRVRS